MITNRKGDPVKSLKKCKKILLLFSLAAAFLLVPVNRTEAATNVITKAKNSKVSTGKFVENKKGRRYRYKNGSYAKNKWHSINGKIYYFSSAGYAETGWFTYQKNQYYANSKGQVYYGRWLSLKNKKYYLKSSGIRAEKEWIKKNNKYYYFLGNGVMAVSRQVSSGGKYYYVGADGARRSNVLLTQKGARYFFGKGGVRYQNKWVKYKGKYYYLGKNGAMAKSQWVGDYYVGKDGARKVNCKVDGYYLDGSGKKVKPLKFSGEYLIVGDSRTVGMDLSVSTSKTKFIGKVSMGYDWLKSVAGPKVRQYLAGNPKLKVVFAFGVNDYGNIEKYVSYYKSLMKEFPDTKFYFLSVNPVKDDQSPNVKNSHIKSFNARLKKEFGKTYIDSYTYLTKSGFSTTDGIHYTTATYKKIYNYILKKAV